MVVLNDQALRELSAAPEPAAAAAPAQPSNRVLERSHWERRYATNLRITDAIVVGGAVILAQYVRFGSTPASPGFMGLDATGYSVLLAAVWVLALAAFHTRCARYIGTGIEEYRRLIAASFWTFWVIAAAELIVKLQISRMYLAVALPAGLVGLVVSRWMWRRYVAQRHAEGRYQTAVLVVGELDAVLHLAGELTACAHSGYQVVGFCIPGYGPPWGQYFTVNGRKIPVVGGEHLVVHAIRTCDADTVAIAGAGQFGAAELRRLLWQLEPMGVDLVVSPGVMDVALSRLTLRPIAGLPLLHIDKPQYRGTERFAKRAFDFCFALVALIVALPIMCVAAFAIKLGSRGPVLYSSERIGIDGRPFSMLKFRTMVNGADDQLSALKDRDEGEGLLFKIRDDPRVTPVGRLLRRFSIDELPQFINVLRREMSVVGPRPPLRREVEAYDGDVQRRLLVRPGITGLWQVGGRSDLPWDKAVRLDLSYVDNWSMGGDLVIIAKTFQAVIDRTGAY
ncbi:MULTISPECIES: sugar transferase [unclassified Mycobacterium]|uniref:sugar transferase n=1 Tax=unclassified Mycobacterium TaxID=2642494 RepID=UPI0029C8BD31|nr:MULTISPECIES: sugar transferase [unclassified Mycobacterium]